MMTIIQRYNLCNIYLLMNDLETSYSRIKLEQIFIVNPLSTLTLMLG